jgi:hypothetical protein
MIIGDTSSFAIECRHDPIPNESRRVYGRVRLWAEGRPILGNIDEPDCWLDPIGGVLEDFTDRLSTLDDPAVSLLPDLDAFQILDRAIYVDDERSDNAISQDLERFSRFDFLTNHSEAFDRTKSFLVGGDPLRLLVEADGTLRSARVAQANFVHVVQAFVAWLAEERKRAG